MYSNPMQAVHTFKTGMWLNYINVNAIMVLHSINHFLERSKIWQVELTQTLPIKMCVQESQLAPKAEVKVCHVAHMDAFQETDSADTHA